MALMSLGMFVFDLLHAPFQSRQKQAGWRHPANSRVGLRPARQYIGPDGSSITLQGVLMPELTGGKASLDELERMADTGKAYALLDGAGNVEGVFVIERLDQTASYFFSDGAARRIEFSVTLQRVDDDDASNIATPSLD